MTAHDVQLGGYRAVLGLPYNIALNLPCTNRLDIDADTSRFQIGGSVDSSNVKLDVAYDLQETNAEMRKIQL